MTAFNRSFSRFVRDITEKVVALDMPEEAMKVFVSSALKQFWVDYPGIDETERKKVCAAMDTVIQNFKNDMI